MVSSLTLSLFAGAFSLVNITRTLNGTVIPDTTAGANPAGVIVYSPTGFMSVVITSTTPADRPTNVSFPATSDQPDSVWALIGKHSEAYTGPFHFNESVTGVDGDFRRGQIVHGPLLANTIPSGVGTLQRRDFVFSEDGMFLNLAASLEGGYRDSLWWRRLVGNVTVNGS